MKSSGLTGSTLAALVVALCFGAPAAAQAPAGPTAGTIEIGGFGQWTSFDENAGRPNVVPEDGFGFGGRLGFFLSPRFELEGDGWYSPQDRDLDESFCCTGERATQVRASGQALRLNYNFPLGLMGGASQLIIGAGAARTNYAFAGGTDDGTTTDADSAVTSYGGSALVGLRMGLTRWLAARVDGVADYMPSHEPEANLNLHARAGLSLLLGGARAVPVIPPPPPPLPPLPPPPPPPPPPPAQQATTAMSVCVVQNGMLSSVQAQYNPSTRDTTVNGRPFGQAYPAAAAPYASGAAWYIQNEHITVGGRRFVKFGMPRVLGVNDVVRADEYQGIPVFAEAGTARPDVVYVPVRPGCEFQPYQTEVKAGAVRGE
jgi:Outer membrane protein beta-barrel domain